MLFGGVGHHGVNGILQLYRSPTASGSIRVYSIAGWVSTFEHTRLVLVLCPILILPGMRQV